MTDNLTPAPAGALDERDSSRYIGYRPPTLRKWRRENTGPAYIKVGRSIRYLIVDLDVWLDQHRVETRESRRAS